VLPLFWKLMRGLFQMLLSQAYGFTTIPPALFHAQPGYGDTSSCGAVFLLSAFVCAIPRPRARHAVRHLDCNAHVLARFCTAILRCPGKGRQDFSKYNPAYYLLTLSANTDRTSIDQC